MTKEEAYQEVSQKYPHLSEDEKWAEVSVLLNKNGDLFPSETPSDETGKRMTFEEARQTVENLYPDMSEEGKMTQVSVMLSAEDVISKAGPNVSPTENLLILVLNKAQDWLKSVFPEIFRRVSKFFDDLLNSIPTWAKKGIQYIIDMIVKYYRD